MGSSNSTSRARTPGDSMLQPQAVQATFSSNNASHASYAQRPPSRDGRLRFCCVPVPMRRRHRKGKQGVEAFHKAHSTSNTVQMSKSLNFLSSSIPLTMRPMKVLLVSSHGNCAPGDAQVKALKSAAEELNMPFDVAYSCDQMRHYYNHSKHDVVFIDRRYHRPSQANSISPDPANVENTVSGERSDAMKVADELCSWIRKHDVMPCAIVAVEEPFANGEMPCNMKELIKLGYDLSIRATDHVSHCVQHLLQLEHNNFHWWLKMEAADALRLALDNVADPVEIVDNQFRMQYVNLAYERLLGNSREKLIGQRIPSSLNPPISTFNSGSFLRKSSEDPLHCPSKPATATSHVPSSANLSSTPNNNLTDEPSYTKPQFRRGSTGSGHQASVPLLYPIPNTVRTPLKPQLSASSTFALGRPTLASSVRRKSMPEAQHNAAPVRFFPVHSKDGRIIHYVTIRSTSQYHGGLHLADFINGTSPNMPFIYQRYPSRDRYSFTIEAPIHKVISILSSAQQYSNISVAQELQKVLDILQTTDLYATQKQSVVACREVDPATTDLVEGLLTSSRIFTSEADTRRRSNPHTAAVLKRSSRPSEIMTQHIQQVLDNVSNNRVNLIGIPEDISESLEGDDRWDYDILRLEEVTVKRPLKFLALRICERFSVVEVLNTSETTLANWLIVVEDHYRQSNSYHNATHAADVMQSSAYFLEKESLKEIFGPFDEVATILASIVHDMDHPGRTNPFLINSRNRLAILYNDMAVLENHHVSLCYQLTGKDERIDIFKNLSREDYQLMRQCIVDMVLATEMAKHFEHLTKFMNVVQKKTSLVSHGRDASGKMSESFTTDSLSQQRRSSGQAGLYVSNMSVEEIADMHEDWVEYARKPECRANIRRILIKCSDISNPTRPLRLCKIWAERIAEEYFSQTDEEKANNLPVVMPWFDRHTCNIAKSQLSFIDVFLKGMIEAWDSFIDVPELMENLNANHAYWTSLLSAESGATLPTPEPISVPKTIAKKEEEDDMEEEGSNIIIDFNKSESEKDP